MKNLIVISVLFVNLIVFSQNEEKKEKFKKPVFYVGIGLLNQKLDINDKLKSANVATLRETPIEFIFGLNFFEGKFSGDLEFSTALSKNDNENSENVYANFSPKLRFHYNLIKKEKYAFTTGLNFAFSRIDATFYSKNNVVDLNNLQPSNNFGQFSLSNNSFYVGPNVSLYLLKHKKSALRINLGYEFAIYNGNWYSNFATINNTIRESGNNRFILGISLL